MARISGVDLPKEKRVEIGLTYIYGIGKATSDEILKTTGIDPDKRVKDLSDDEVAVLRNYIEHNLQVEGDLKRQVALNIKRLGYRLNFRWYFNFMCYRFKSKHI